jgi:DNA-binding NtrC family response regulator
MNQPVDNDSKQVLVVDDEPSMRTALLANFRRQGWVAEEACGASEAVTKFRQRRFPLVVTDIRMPDGDGLQVMRQVRALSPQTGVILLTAYGNVPDAVDAIRSGACDYLIKPVPFEQLHALASRVLAKSRRTDDDHEIIGHSTALLRSLQRARQVAPFDVDVLIEAESGTGKELLARMVHAGSPRRAHPFVAVNCAAIPEPLLESELFGHARGAFTGANLARLGKVQQAHSGTLLLDEIGEMPLSLQPKLLRVLQEREFDPLGGDRTVRVDLRVICTTNCSLRQLVDEGRFRADLYYRLNVIPLSLPPLRERREDVAELAEHFAARYATESGKDVPKLRSDFIAALQQRDWPGNIRELANVMRRVVVLSNGHEIGAEALDEFSGAPGKSNEDRLEAGLPLRELERRLVQMTLEATDGNRTRAAELLGVSLRTIRNKIRDYGLPPRRYA